MKLRTPRPNIKWFVVAPAGKTVAFVAFTVIAAVLSGTFVTELATPRGLAWGRYHHTVSFWGLIILALLQYLYQRASYAFEVGVSHFRDSDWCTAYALSKFLPAAADYWEEKIRNGQGGELVSAMDEVRRALK